MKSRDKLVLGGLGLMLAMVAGVALFWPSKPARNLVAESANTQEMTAALLQMGDAEKLALVAREKQRMIAEPLDISALNNLAILKNLSGDKSGADLLLQEASNRTWHDPLAQFSAMKSGLAAADYERAFKHLDGLLTTLPNSAETVLPLVLPALDDEAALKALSNVLKRNPPWRNSFTAWLKSKDQQATISYQLLAAMRRDGLPDSDVELRQVLEQMMAAKLYERAYYVWLDSLDPNSLLKVRGLFDGQFSLPARNLFFDWNLTSPANSTVHITDDAAGRQKLRLEFYKMDNHFNGVFQYLRLSPGSYQIGGDWAAHDLKASEGLVWQISCVEVAKILGASQRFKEPSTEAKFTFKLTVPTESCATQKLELVSASNLALELSLDGDISFSNLNLELAGTVK